MLRNAPCTSRLIGRKFLADNSGNIAIISGLVLTVLILASGSALDFARASKAKQELGDALDTAALSAAKDFSAGGFSDSQVRARAENIFNANFDDTKPKGGSLIGFTMQRNAAAKTVTVTASANLPTTFMAITGIKDLDIRTKAVARYSDIKVEMAMMLDVTGSMSGVKIADLKIAATDAIDILLPRGYPVTDRVRVGLVPYSNSVNAGPFATRVTDGVSSNCVTERAGQYAFLDQLPQILPPDADTILGAAASKCPTAQIVPITSDREKLHTEIAGFTAGGYTAGHLGIAWTWYLLSPNWQSIWPAGSSPNRYGNRDTIKVAVLMTDGQFNTYYEPGNGNSNRQSANLCANMKSEGVVVYSVAFKAPVSAKVTLQDCASSRGHYFDAANGAELQASFAKIATDVRLLYLSQ